MCSCGCGVCWVSLYTILFLLTVLADHLSAMLECSPEYPHRSADPPIEVPRTEDATRALSVCTLFFFSLGLPSMLSSLSGMSKCRRSEKKLVASQSTLVLTEVVLNQPHFLPHCIQGCIGLSMYVSVRHHTVVVCVVRHHTVVICVVRHHTIAVCVSLDIILQCSCVARHHTVFSVRYIHMCECLDIISVS